MLIEFLTIKLALDAIMKECNRLAYEQDLREQARMLKTKLFNITANYEKGLMSKETFEKEEAAIMAELGRLMQQINTLKGSSN